ncbi:GNAT family N-acetyltransferase [Mesorhizobium sp. M7A.F.Ca.CA.001.07.2.1]|jgi:ribosomal protein S18 acetylase RimI-like enzyme|uniref:GNAT family N-acetyltransferase n=2 Tax=Phyllobacteriaceae TaxID=69277 RepID=UPI000FCBD3D7|nr:MULTISPECIES: GNAT family N-acetyltransferase [Mesorhizobium]RVB38609.1 GNAT family N-acetyltransferase [Mesorhizobium sp. M7A.F.Ca.CA.004.05.1.1]RWN95344.1 MAG: GNAT family N-acetyltransferase [Mesorhizobium sp.]MCF6122557.1 GNAT family N-acetyltransferase [Mesorhizobium ciceri]MCQ8815606.1 GNAT family N-acetyltransferase [Mesorhizobium sp. SEMIA396]RUX73743.1 GNAT family N-acetyltransferase [Mesorhizobium sp. M7A.F.Ca.CA.004.08.2.1]
MKIRRALAGDLQTVVSLTQAAYAPYTALLGAPPIPVTEDYAPRIARGEVWVLESGGGLAGLITLERHDDHAMIFSVAVSPDFQGKGFGIALLKHADELTRLWGLPEVRLYTNARMERNIALYLAYGFHETGRRPNPYRPGWVLVDMAKSVHESTAA